MYSSTYNPPLLKGMDQVTLTLPQWSGDFSYPTWALGIIETGRSWPTLPEHGRIRFHFRGHLPYHHLSCNMSHNTYDKASPSYQPGVTEILLMGSIVGRKMDLGTNESRLVQYTRKCFRGKGGASSIIVATYHPVRPGKTINLSQRGIPPWLVGWHMEVATRRRPNHINGIYQRTYQRIQDKPSSLRSTR